MKFARVKKDDQSQGFLPTLATVKSGEYPISRFLFFYLRSQPKGQTKQFIDWILTPEGQEIVTKVGYFPMK